MKPQKLDSINYSGNISALFRRFGLMLLGMVLLWACKNDIEYINALSDELESPIQTMKNFEVQYTDSGRLQVIFRAPLMERFLKNEEEGTYYEFREGIKIVFYNRDEEVESMLTARYGEYWDEKSLGFASDSVVAKNIITGEELNTEELYWERDNQKIYSNVFTKISNDEGVYFGEKGFESDQGFENYKLLGSRGTVNVEDEEVPQN